MQVNRLGIVLIAFFGLGGLLIAAVPIFVSIPAQAAFTLVLLGGIWALVGLGLFLYARRSRRKAAHQDEIFRAGLTGTATVVSAGSSVTVNEMPLMSMELDLEVPGFERRRVRRREVMSVFAARRIEPGLVLPVYANPQDPADFVLVW